MTRALLLLQIAAAIGITAALLSAGRASHALTALAAGVGIMLLLRLLITANNFFVSWRFRSATPPAYRIGPLQACRLFTQEFAATMTASSVTMPFCGFTQRLAPHPSGLPVLLVHGYICNSGYWRSMSKALLDACISHRALDLEPILGDIDDYAACIDEAVQTLRRDSGSERVVILAHSMGGLAARAYLRRHGSGDIAKLITLGTPHHGTAVAQFGLGPNSRQMQWQADESGGRPSAWLRELAASEDAARRALCVSIYTHHDNIIAPQTSSNLPGAKNVEFGGIGHVALASHPAIQARVLREIRETSQAGVNTEASPAAR